MVDHFLLYCAKTWVLWNLLFSLFGVSWILSCSMKKTLLGWHGAFMGKVRKKAWQMAPLCLFWTVWKERNIWVFSNEEFSLQRLKNSFVCNLRSWVRVSMDLSPSSLVSFIDWLGSKQGQVMFLFLSLPLWFESFGFFCILSVCSEDIAFGVSSYLYIHLFLSIKK